VVYVSARVKARKAANRRQTAQNRAAAAAHRAELLANPEVQALREALAADTEAQAIIAADRPAQAARLAAAGYRRRYDGEDGAGCWDQPHYGLRVIHSVVRETDGQVWGHVSLSRRDGRLPSWEETRDAHRLLYPTRPGLVIIPPEAEHVDLGEVTHTWTCLTATPVPDFTRGLGVI
jgi:hypothetical protein